jgi:hypothetical protein
MSLSACDSRSQRRPGSGKLRGCRRGPTRRPAGRTRPACDSHPDPQSSATAETGWAPLTVPAGSAIRPRCLPRQRDCSQRPAPRADAGAQFRRNAAPPFRRNKHQTLPLFRDGGSCHRQTSITSGSAATMARWHGRAAQPRKESADLDRTMSLPIGIRIAVAASAASPSLTFNVILGCGDPG